VTTSQFPSLSPVRQIAMKPTIMRPAATSTEPFASSTNTLMPNAIKKATTLAHTERAGDVPLTAKEKLRRCGAMLIVLAAVRRLWGRLSLDRCRLLPRRRARPSRLGAALVSVC
jgi:hypothetical protein